MRTSRRSLRARGGCADTATASGQTALRYGQAYARLDKGGPWADQARGQIRKQLGREKLPIAWRAESFIAPRKGTAALELVSA